MYFLEMESNRPGIERGSIRRAFAVSLAVSAGFMAVFVAIGTITKVVTGWFLDKAPWISLAIGIALVVLGVAMMFGYRLPLTTPRLDVGRRDRSVADSELVAFRVGHQDPGAAVLAAGFLPDTLGAQHGEPGRFDDNVWGLDVKVHPVLGLLDIVELSVMLPTSCRVHVRAEGREGSGSMGKEGVPVYLERSRLRFTGCATEGVDWWPNRDLHEPGVFQHLLPARTGQPASNSTRPQIDVAHRLDGYRTAIGDVSELQHATWTQHAVDLGEHRLFVGAKVDHTVGDDHIRPSVLDRQALGEALAKLDVTELKFFGGGSRLGEHLGGHVDPDHPAGQTNLGSGNERVKARAGTDVNDTLPWFKSAQRERVADPGK